MSEEKEITEEEFEALLDALVLLCPPSHQQAASSITLSIRAYVEQRERATFEAARMLTRLPDKDRGEVPNLVVLPLRFETFYDYQAAQKKGGA